MNESAGTEMGPMEAAVATIAQTNLDPVVFTDVIAKARKVDAVVNALARQASALQAEVDRQHREGTTAAHDAIRRADRLADALRDGKEELRTWMAHGPHQPLLQEIIDRFSRALTDIPDCPHAQRVKFLEGALTAIESANSTEIFAWLDVHDPTGRTRVGDVRTHVARAALTASTGEAQG